MYLSGSWGGRDGTLSKGTVYKGVGGVRDQLGILQEGRQRDFLMDQVLLPPLDLKGKVEVVLQDSRETSRGESCSQEL